MARFARAHFSIADHRVGLAHFPNKPMDVVAVAIVRFDPPHTIVATDDLFHRSLRFVRIVRCRVGFAYHNWA